MLDARRHGTVAGIRPRQRQSFTAAMHLGDDGAYALTSPPITCPGTAADGRSLRGTGKVLLQLHAGGRIRKVKRTAKFTGTLAP